MRKFGLSLVGISFLFVYSLQAQTGPGGVDVNDGTGQLELWLDANSSVYIDAGITKATNGQGIQQWNDLSGNGNHATQTGSGKPVFTSSGYNGYPKVSFTSASTQYLNLSGLTLDPNASDYTTVSVFTSKSGNHVIIQQQDGTGTGRTILQKNSSNTKMNSTISGSNNLSTANYVTSTTEIYTQTFTSNGATSALEYYKLGIGDGSFTPTPESADGAWLLGVDKDLSSNAFDGDLSEVIVFSKVINLAERTILGNYLAAKYGLVLSANDFYTMDNGANGNFDYQVAGIGKASDGSSITDAKGSGYVRINTASDLEDGEFLIWGHNNAALDLNTSDVPSGTHNRLNRVWRADLNGGDGVGTVSVTFDLANFIVVDVDELELLIDADGTFSAGATSHTTGISLDTNNYTVTFTGVSFSDGDYFTLGSKVSTNRLGGIYYSRANGNYSTSGTWSTAGPGGASCACTPPAVSANVLISGHTVTITGNTALTKLRVAGGGVLKYGANSLRLDIRSGGSLFVQDGFVNRNGKTGTRIRFLDDVTNALITVGGASDTVIDVANITSTTATMNIYGSGIIVAELQVANTGYMGVNYGGIIEASVIEMFDATTNGKLEIFSGTINVVGDIKMHGTGQKITVQSDGIINGTTLSMNGNTDDNDSVLVYGHLSLTGNMDLKDADFILINEGTFNLDGNILSTAGAENFINQNFGTWNWSGSSYNNATMTLDASENTFIYDGSASYTVLRPSCKEYWNVGFAGTGSYVLGDSLFALGDVDISSSLDVDVTNNYPIYVSGDWDNTGTFDARAGEVLFGGASFQYLSGNTNFYDFSMDNGSGVEVLSGSDTITHILDIDNGPLTTNDSITLKNTTTTQAFLADIGTGSVNGDITYLQEMNFTLDEWIQLGSPAKLTTLNDWYGDFITSGFTGSTFPAFIFNSVYYYNENDANGVGNDGWLAATNITNNTRPDSACYVYMTAGLTTIDVSGEPYQGTKLIPLKYQNISAEELAADASEKGWNLIGNPYMCTVDWNNLTAGDRNNIENTIWIWSGSNGNFGSYVGGAGSGTNGVDQYITGAQGFWVHATADGPSIIFNEEDKTTTYSDFVKSNENTQELRITLSSSVNTYKDESLIHFNAVHTSGYDDGYDALKKWSLLPEAPGMALFTLADTTELTISALPESTLMSGIDVMMRVYVGISGDYKLDINHNDISNCMILEDLKEGTFINLQDFSEYEFSHDVADNGVRFILHFGQQAEVSTQNVSCYQHNDGTIVLKGAGQGLFDYNVFNAQGTLIFNTSSSDSVSLNNLKSGLYSYQILGNEGYCPAQEDMVYITQPLPFQVSMNTLMPNNGSDNGLIEILNVVGGQAPYVYSWADGDTSSVRNGLQEGVYELTITDAGGCSWNKTFDLSNTSNSVAQVLEKGVVQLYPNPTKDQLHVLLNKNGFSKIKINNSMGQIVDFKEVENKAKGHHVLDVTSLASGSYFLQLTDSEDKLIASEKFQIQ